MRFGPKRGHFLFLFEHVIQDFFPMLIAGGVSLARHDMTWLLENWFFIVLIAAGPFTRLVKWLTTRYSADDEKLIVTSGWLKKSRQEVPLSTITAVDMSANVLQQMAGAVRLTIDNASNISEVNTNLSMTFKESDAKALRDILIEGKPGLDGMNIAEDTARSAGDEGDTATAAVQSGAFHDAYLFTPGDLLIMGALRSKGAFLIQGIALVFAGIGFLGGLVSEEEVENVSKGILDRLADRWAEFPVTGTLVFLAVLFVVSAVIAAIGTLFKYYGFRVRDNGAALRIEYGLLNKKRFTIPKDRVTGFFYEQSLFMRLFHRGVLHCFSIGYGSGDGETMEEPLLIPLLREKDLYPAMTFLLPELSEVTETYRPTKASARYFAYSGTFVFYTLVTIGLLAAGVLISKNFYPFAVLAFLFGLGSAVLQYRHTSLYTNDKAMGFTNGGYKKTSVYVKTRSVESADVYGTKWKQRRGFCNLQVNYIAPAASSVVVLKNLPEAAFEATRRHLIY